MGVPDVKIRRLCFSITQFVKIRRLCFSITQFVKIRRLCFSITKSEKMLFSHIAWRTVKAGGRLQGKHNPQWCYAKA